MLGNEDKKPPPPPTIRHGTVKAGNGSTNSSNYNAAVSIVITAVFCLSCSNIQLGGDTC